MMKSATKLRAVAEHIVYEVEMMHATHNALASGRHADDTVVRNALVNSCATHIRSLLNFLYPSELYPRAPEDSEFRCGPLGAKKSQKARKDDISASDYFEFGRWQAIAGALPDVLADVHRRVAKQIVHLTYKRANLSAAEKQWNFNDLISALRPAIKCFAEETSPSHLPDDAKQKLLLAIQAPHRRFGEPAFTSSSTIKIDSVSFKSTLGKPYKLKRK